MWIGGREGGWGEGAGAGWFEMGGWGGGTRRSRAWASPASLETRATFPFGAGVGLCPWLPKHSRGPGTCGFGGPRVSLGLGPRGWRPGAQSSEPAGRCLVTR